VPLIPDDPQLSALLRFAQLRVAVATDEMSRAATLLDKALFESSVVQERERQYLSVLLWATVLVEPRIPMPPNRWLGMLLDFTASPLVQSLILRSRPPDSIFSGLLAKASPDEILFIVRATALRSVGELAELLNALEQKPKAIRDRYIGAAARSNQSLHLVVAASWLAEVKHPAFDARAAAATYYKLSQAETARDNPDLAVELLCAEAIMLDQYADDRDGALEVLRLAQEAYPRDYRPNRQRQKVFYGNKQHAEALAEFEGFCDRMPLERGVDRAYAMREAGRSAAEIGELDKTRMFFEQAWEASRLCGASMTPMTAGLSADCAILDFDADKTESALNLMRRALLEADDLDPRAGVKESFVKRVPTAAILYMRGAAVDFPAARQVRVIGMCSEPDPLEWFRTQPQPQPTFVWYQLAEFEAEATHSHEVLAELRKRTRSGGLLPMETTLVSRLAEAAVRDLDVDGFLETLKTYPRAVVDAIRNLRGWGGGDVFNQPLGHLVPIAESEWKNDSIAQSTKNAVLSFMLVCGSRGRGDVMADFRQKIMRIPGLAAEVEGLFHAMDEPSEDETDAYVIVPSVVGRLLKGEAFDVNDVFLSAVYLLQLLENSLLAPPAAAAMMRAYPVDAYTHQG
jgi:hypothetical protein